LPRIFRVKQQKTNNHLQKSNGSSYPGIFGIRKFLLNTLGPELCTIVSIGAGCCWPKPAIQNACKLYTSTFCYTALVMQSGCMYAKGFYPKKNTLYYTLLH
jgi:hypothetical protein